MSAPSPSPLAPEDALAALPGPLPPGEHVLWAARPDAGLLERGLFRRRAVLIVATLLALWPVLTALEAGLPVPVALAGALLFAPFVVPVLVAMRLAARLTARHTLYVLTERRIVIQAGYVYARTVNIPLAAVRDVALRRIGADGGDLQIAVDPDASLTYGALMPHARLLHLLHPTPVLRAVAGVDAALPLFAELARPGVRPAEVEAVAAGQGA
ncbi:PH (Pleckstrin Homology) domain-containing protein [Hasllibacter halocynthiae]|uniref:PH (Pleckstrin Homology) domain-containing protein n=1 Tax=Hasllibacter halocynthiae TaxID=595589 RepID=A0A2T0WZA5_9RHOB|nr:PH domain-containing protein [Hasllibacter halocynthiae]PRY92042.1 PH (Pleckstrin Homology) domain-containing protein [Hasllibacter halocynthiae]